MLEKGRARRDIYAIKRNIKLDIPIKIWQKIFDAGIEPIALYRCEVLGPLTNQDFIKSEEQKIKLYMLNSANQY